MTVCYYCYQYFDYEIPPFLESNAERLASGGVRLLGVTDKSLGLDRALQCIDITI
jgi:hypothetical protein